MTSSRVGNLTDREEGEQVPAVLDVAFDGATERWVDEREMWSSDRVDSG